VRAAVVGGGIAGLCAAWELSGRGVQVDVYEPGRLGGKIRTGEFLGHPVDEGPDALLARAPEGVALCQELGLGDDLVSPQASRAMLWSGGRLRPFPEGLVLGAPARLLPLARSGVLSVPGMARALGDLVLPRSPVGDDESVFDLVARRFGPEVAEKLVEPLVGSIYAGTTRGLSAATTVPQLLGAARSHRSLLRALKASSGARSGGGVAAAGGAAAGAGGPAPAPAGGPGGAAGGAAAGAASAVFVAPRGGLQAIVDRLVSELGGPERGTAFLARPVESLRRDGAGVVVEPGGVAYDGAVVAAPAGPAARVLSGLIGREGPGAGGTEGPAATAGTAGAAGALAASLADLAGTRFSSVGIVTLGFATGALPVPAGLSGVLVAPGSEMLMTACSFATNKWPHWSGPGTVVVRVSVGKLGDERWEHLDDDELARRCCTDLARALGMAPPPEPLPGGRRVSRWPSALPQYPVGHLAKMELLRRHLSLVAPTVTVAGASYGRVGVPANIAAGRQAGEWVHRALQAAAGAPR
jgi:oxygen-dependent protoporphyrinogen oxidase